MTRLSYASERWLLKKHDDWIQGTAHVSSKDLLRGRSVAAWLGESGAFGCERRRALQSADLFGPGIHLTRPNLRHVALDNLQ